CIKIIIGRQINVKKTKVMSVSKRGEGVVNIVIEGVRVEQLDRVKCLGSMITSDRRRESEITIRIGMAKDAFGKRKELLAQKMNRSLKKRIIKTTVRSVALYGEKTWTSR